MYFYITIICFNSRVFQVTIVFKFDILLHCVSVISGLPKLELITLL